MGNRSPLILDAAPPPLCRSSMFLPDDKATSTRDQATISVIEIVRGRSPKAVEGCLRRGPIAMRCRDLASRRRGLGDRNSSKFSGELVSGGGILGWGVEGKGGKMLEGRLR